MDAVTRYQCKWCHKDFKTATKHDCKRDPVKRNCFSCANLLGWKESDDGIYVGEGGYLREPNYPDCSAKVDGWDIEMLKRAKYHMACSEWVRQ